MAIGGLFLIACFLVFPSVNGCGQLPQRQGRTLNFEVTGFKLPPAMVYSEDNSDPSRVPRISTSEQQAVTFVQNIVIQSVQDILQQQGRGAGLSYDVISLILNQLDVTVTYTPLKCARVFIDLMGAGVVVPMMTNCQVINDVVTKTCVPAPLPPPVQPGQQVMCTAMMLENINPLHLKISGNITTTNIIMANWSSQMWQIVLNRVVQNLASGPLGSYFIGASIILK